MHLGDFGQPRVQAILQEVFLKHKLAGSFLFDGLAGGDYMLRFVAPSGAKFTWRMAGADTTADSDADGNGWSLCVSVPAGSSRRGVDAGLLY